MPALRILLLLSAAGMVVASTISDPIVSDVALAPLLLVTVILGIANLSADLVRPRRRLDVWCSALTIAAPFPFLALGQPWGLRAGAAALAALQLAPLVVGRGRARRQVAGPRRLLAALVISTALLLVAVVALVWYGATYLLPPPAGAFARNPYLIRLTTSQAAFAWQTTSGQPVRLTLRTPAGGSLTAVHGRFADLHAATRYEWSAEVNGVSAAAGAFRTAPTSTADPIRLVTFGDYGSGNSHEYAVGRLAAAADPSMFLSAGDNAYLLAAPPLLDRAIFDPLHQLLGEAVTVAALGEHDLAWRDGAVVISALHLPGHHGPVRPRTDRGAGTASRRVGAQLRRRDARTLRRHLPGAVRPGAPPGGRCQPDHAAAPPPPRGRDPGRPPAPLRAPPAGRGPAVHRRHRRRGAGQRRVHQADGGRHRVAPGIRVPADRRPRIDDRLPFRRRPRPYSRHRPRADPVLSGARRPGAVTPLQARGSQRPRHAGAPPRPAPG
jgi:hypothetical protein